MYDFQDIKERLTSNVFPRMFKLTGLYSSKIMWITVLSFTGSDSEQWKAVEIDIRGLMAMLLFNYSALTITSRRKESRDADGGISMKRLTLERSVFLLLSDFLIQLPDKAMHEWPRIMVESHLC